MKKSFVNFIENHGEIIAWVRSGMPKVSASAKESFSFDLQMFAIVPLNGKNIADLFTNGCQKVCFDSIIVTDRGRRRRFWGSPFLILEEEKIYLDGDSFGEGLSKKDIKEKFQNRKRYETRIIVETLSERRVCGKLVLPALMRQNRKGGEKYENLQRTGHRQDVRSHQKRSQYNGYCVPPQTRYRDHPLKM